MASIASPVPARKISPQQFAGLVQGVSNTYKEAPLSVRAAGKLWYPRAQAIAEEVGSLARRKNPGLVDHDMSDLTRGAGIISALSPQNRWEKNVQHAKDFARTGKAPLTGDHVAKARAILEGVHPDEVMDPARTGGSSHKTFNFFHNIEDPDDPNYVTIDRHAHDLAVGRRFGDDEANPRGLSAAGRYNHFKNAYIAAATHLGVEHPSSVQAATWLHWTGRPE